MRMWDEKEKSFKNVDVIMKTAQVDKNPKFA
jgi:hypothetical protein